MSRLSRPGFALVAALISVVLLGALIVGAFLATTEETRIAANTGLAERSLNAAEAAAEGDLSGWAATQWDSLAAGQRVKQVRTAYGLQITTTLTRLNQSVFWLVGEAKTTLQSASGAPAIQRRIGVLLRRVTDSTGQTSLLRLEDRAWSELF